jgi:PIN domain nuclease of toxin-antitoxin system
MKRYLLDTQALLYWFSGNRKLGSSARKVMEDSKNELLVSVVTSWEIGIKYALGKLSLPGAPERYLPAAYKAHQLSPIGFEHAEALAAGSLPLHHDDPFDRGLIAQAISRNLTVITGDGAFDAYPVRTIW